MGLEVSIYTESSSGTRWFEVDSNPSNPEVWFANGNNNKENSCIIILYFERDAHTQVPPETGRGQHGRIHSDGEQPASRP
jgi:hypothetical protein